MKDHSDIVNLLLLQAEANVNLVDPNDDITIWAEDRKN